MFESTSFSQAMSFANGEQVTDLLLLSYSLNLRMMNDVILKCGIIDTYPDPKTVASHITCAVQNDRGAGDWCEQGNNRYAYLALCAGRIWPQPYNGRSFHPKLWGFLYRKGGKTHLRLVISSRNLTSQNMLEGFICLEGVVDGTAQHKNNPLLTLLKKAGIGAENPVYEAISNTSFTPCIQGLSSYEMLIPEGKETGLHQALLASSKSATKCVAMSPFLGKTAVDELLRPGMEYTIITRKTSYTQEFATSQWKYHYLTQQPNPETDQDTPTDHTHSFEDDEAPLHAKMYAFDLDTGESHLYIGSANFSENGFQRNSELMVKIVSKTMHFAQLLYGQLESSLAPCTKVAQDDASQPIQGIDIVPTLLTQAELEKISARIQAEQAENDLWKALVDVFGAPQKPAEHPLDYVIRLSLQKNSAPDWAPVRDQLRGYTGQEHWIIGELKDAIGGHINGL